MHCLSFKIVMTHPWEKLYFAPSIPYTYSSLVNHLQKIKTAQEGSDFKIVEIEPLCKTLGGLEVPLLTITNFNQQEHIQSSSNKYIRK